MRPYLLLLLLVFGCVSQQAATQVSIAPEGIRILKADVLRPELMASEQTDLFLQVQNVGESAATDIKAELVRDGGFKCDASACSEKKLGNLNPPDIVLKVAGEMAEANWVLTAPDVQTQTDKDLTLRMKYNYRADGTSEVRAMKLARMREIEQTGAKAEATTSSSQTPVKVTVHTPDPVLLEDSGKKTFNFEVLLENAGKGVVRSPVGLPEVYLKDTWCAGEGLNCVDKVEIKLGGASANDKIECEKYASTGITAIDMTNTPSNQKTVELKHIKLWQGQTARISCEMTVNADMEAYPIITATASYQYSIDAPVSVRVLPKRA